MDADVDRQAIERTALDYFEGWYEGDPVRMERALHDDLVKRSFDADGHGTLGAPRGKAQMVEVTGGGGGRARGPAGEQGIEVEILDLYRRTASVVVRSREYHEHVHLVRTSEGWKIVNTLWESSR